MSNMDTQFGVYLLLFVKFDFEGSKIFKKYNLFETVVMCVIYRSVYEYQFKLWC